MEDQDDYFDDDGRDEDDSSDYSFSGVQDHGWGDVSDDESLCQRTFDDREMSNKWNDVKNPYTVVTFDQAVHDSWEIAKVEIRSCRENIVEKLRLKRFSDYTLDLLVDYIVKRIWRIVDSCLNGKPCYTVDDPLTVDQFKKILATFFIASSFGVSTENLFADEWISHAQMCTKDEYKRFWKGCVDRDSVRYDSSRVYFWQKLLDEVNEICRDLFLSGWEPHAEKHVTMDDDKVHFNGSMGYANTSGLKPSQFVRDNRKGFTFHTLVFTASGIPLGLEPELVTDSSSTDTSIRLLSKQLAPGNRSMALPNLSNVIIYADRLYWIKTFLYKYILPSGAEIGPCTHKRTHHFPFTYDQKLTRNDTRQLISKKGSKCIFLKEQRVGPHTLSAIAYRDGYGKVAMGISSSTHYSVKHWDFHLSDPRDRYKLLDEDGNWSYSLATWIRNLNANDGLSSEFIDLFETTSRVKGITTEGSEDQAWFLARSFSFTSSTTDKVIHTIYDLVRRDESAADIELVENLNIILDYLNKPKVTLNSDTNSSSSSDSESTDRDEPRQEPEIVVDGLNLSNELRLLNQNNAEFTAAFLAKLNNRMIFSDECVKRFITALGGKPVATRSKNIISIIEWVQLAPVEKRKYHFMKKDALVNCCVSELKGSKTSYTSKTREDLINLLSEPREQLHTANDRPPIPESTEVPSLLSDVLVKQMIGGAILKPLSGHGRQNTRIGLDNEVPLLKRLHDDCKTESVLVPSDNFSSKTFTISEIYRPGMAKKVGMDYVKSSIDALGVLAGAEVGEDPKLVGIEVKTRTEESTRQPEIQIRSNIQRGKKFVKIHYSMAKKFIPINHESIQILHHAFVYNLKLVLLLIGDKKATILRGVWVEFDEEIMDAYSSFLSSCYEKSLKWAYDNNNYNLYENSDDETRLQFIKPFLPPSIDFDSFLDYYKLWRSATAHEHQLPIPPTEYIIPYHFSKWNKFKGGSDTLTKLFWNGKHYVPTVSPASTAVSHMFSFLAATIRRCDAVMDSKEDLSFYSSLYGWRHANNKRQTSYQVFSRRIASCLFDNELATGPQHVTPPRIIGRASRNRVQQVEAVWAGEHTGKTPARNVSGRYKESSMVHPSILQRREECTGKITCRVAIVDGSVQSEGPGARGICVICKMKTRFYCAGCHHWLCGPAKVASGNDKTMVNFVEHANGHRIYFIQSCWHIHHERGLLLDKGSNTPDEE